MSLKEEIERYLVLVQSLGASFQIALESESFPPSFFDATRDLLNVLKEELDDLEAFQNQEQSIQTEEVIVEVPDKKAYPNVREKLSINDSFRFQRDLFAGNKKQMDEILDELNGFNSIDETFLYLHSRFDWDWDDESAIAFKELLEKRFGSV